MDQNQLIASIAAKQMGVPPEQAAPQAPQQKAPAPETPEAKMQTKGSPETEGDKMQKSPVVYEVEFNENDKRKLTPEQIAATFQRYSALNFKNQALAPINKVVESIMRENPGMGPMQIAEKMEAIYKAQQSNPQMGRDADERRDAKRPGQGAPPGQREAVDIDEQLKKWEEENAASLPPGYKEMMTGTTGELSMIKQQLAQTQQMLMAVLGQTQGVADAAKSQVQQVRQDSGLVIKQQIGNNLDRAQQALQLPDDAANDFLTFASERGYTLEDFVDPQLTFRVMSDFRNNMNSPEMERLRAIASRRQAYTGSLAGSPSAGAMPTGTQPAGFDAFADKIMKSKGIS